MTRPTRRPEPQVPIPSRRQFLQATALATTSAVPMISILSGCAPSKTQPASGEAGAATAASYALRAGSRKASPDGRPREISCYNDQYPGPVIRAKLGETLRVKVVNDLAAPTSVHWHGMHQPGTWQMDGVDGVSRPPIEAGSEFTYEFTATPAGTHWYHSHVGVQYGDGLYGPLIVDEETPPAKYDREEILLINDWFLESCEELLAGLIAGSGMKMAGKMEKPVATENEEKPAANTEAPSDGAVEEKKMPAMEGMAAGADLGDVPFESALFNGRGRFNAASQAPRTTIEVKPGETLRLRLINASSTYAFRFQVDGHKLTAFATDGAPMAPVEVDNLVINIGERYDVLLKADQSGAHWIRAATLAGQEGLAVLQYPGDSADALEPSPAKFGEMMLMPQAMRSPESVTLAENPREFKLELGGSMQPYRWNINGEMYPQAEPIKLAQDEHVRFVLVNPTNMDHPFHLHGHYFYVLGDPAAMNLVDPPQKDTVNVPAKSSLAIEWQAINPGHWFFHCHIEWHLATGMARVIEIA
ncbi:MAG: multicopper oxidase family protein [Pirellulales bacterium]|nr:multicopper oxidase family protein [Pirellulales bacterium]